MTTLSWGRFGLSSNLPQLLGFCLWISSQSITVEVTIESGESFIYTAVYASNDFDTRKELWLSLRDTYSSFNLAARPWMVNGDFNEILLPSETSNPAILRTNRAMRLFGDCLTDVGLFDLPFHGPAYTWTNHQPTSPIGKKIDRCLVNGNWLATFPTSHCSFEAPLFSDHTPCVINLITKPPNYGTRSFRFYNMLLKLPSFLETVQEAWNEAGDSATTLSSLCFKLKSLKRPMKSLCKEKFSGIENRVFEAADQLKAIQMVSLQDPSPSNLLLEKSARENWLLLRQAEESFFKQRSRVKWLSEGDFNTSFFHKVMKARNAENSVKYLTRPDGTRAETSQEIHMHAVNYYESIMTSVRGFFSPDLPDFLELLQLPICSHAHLVILTKEITAEEIKLSLARMPSSKTPGPDGFPAEFFRASWGILGAEITATILSFFRSPFMPKALNSTSLVLLQKRPEADELKDYRPISCLNTIYKLITRLLAGKLKSILPEMIVPNQTAFVKDRLLLENVLLASEVIKGYHKLNLSPRMTLKVDISKAFDSVRWDFILSVLQAHKVPSVYLQAIRSCICSPTFSITINGTTSGYFKGKTGLRQGDPLSPSLFVMVMNVLSLMLNKAASEGIFAYHPGCEILKLTHLSFADDLLIFLEGNLDSLKGVFQVLKQFEELSGLVVNISKTSLFCSGIDFSVLADIEASVGLCPSALPIRYLGLPLCTRKLSMADCDPLITQIRKKLNSWTHRLLSLAGRYTLLSSVIPGIVGFWSSAFFLPKAVIRKINSMSSAFFWHGSTDSARGAKVSWHDISFPKKEGGLGLRNLKTWNDTCGLKLIWMLFFRAGSIWVAWIRQKYLSHSPFWALNGKNSGFSWMFRQILKLRVKASSLIRTVIGNGDDTFFWWDPWTPYGPLIHYIGGDGPYAMGIPLFSTVSELKTTQGWKLPPPRSEKQLNLHVFVTTLTPSVSSDHTVWVIDEVIQKSFSSRQVWNCIREKKPEVPWANTIWHKARIPKHAFTAWLFVLNRNPTLDRITRWDFELEQTCLLCGLEAESRNHLFFSCTFSRQVWEVILLKLGIQSPLYQWDVVLQWLPAATGSGDLSLALLQAWQACIYEVWCERNRRFHLGVTFPVRKIIRLVLLVVKDRTLGLVQQNQDRQSLLLCWS
ncbi:unnamed protein product [Microthlaspi erraticum]|uniref:Reverse transcriptase domain-containing protein n=1 Tax=Microthlaspi erraticum TaxID=1685480 RepID=A0A6D2L4N4_9BRAS|nr:unnamed protein product [Microthlaspi erraticum]